MRILLISFCCLCLLSSHVYAGECIDDFENGNADGWNEVAGEWEVQEGAYVQLAVSTDIRGIPRTIIQSPWEFADGSIEVTITFERKSAGTEVPAILYRMIDEDNGYAFRLHSDSMQVGKFLEGQYQDIRGDAQRINIDKAKAAGLSFRPIAVTAMDTLEWYYSDALTDEERNTPPMAITAERETELLALWRRSGSRR